MFVRFIPLSESLIPLRAGGVLELIPAAIRWNAGHKSILYLSYFGEEGFHTSLTHGHYDLISRQRVIPTNCHGRSRNGYGATEFISHESITAEVTIDIY